MYVDRRRRPGLAALQDALAAADLESARSALLLLDGEERAILQAHLGADALDRAYRHARRRRRGPGLGRVIVLPGLMGSELDSIDAAGDSDLLWVHYLRIFQGRLAELRLTTTGAPPAPPPTIRPKQLYLKTYLPILLALQARWQTRPFAYDWRLDVDASAAALADEVRTWAHGEPCHLVAHSMGGIVARRFIQKFPEVWASMQDPSGQGRGGRLVMMGTPNRGSYAITLALSGEEGIVRTLDKLDFEHDRMALLRILNTFLGSYQLLPSPLLDLGGDDHRRLFDAAAWGNLPVHQALLDRGKAFMTELHPVTDAARLLYVAGDHQETPSRIRLDAPGRFRWESTLEGDGRVTHEMGLLEGVTTYWVVEEHGDLPKNAKVLAAIHDLLQTGATAALDTRRAAVRAARGAAPYEPRQREAPDAEVDALVARLRPTRATRGAVTVEQEIAAARLEALVAPEWLGRPAAPSAALDTAAGRAAGRAAEAARPRLRVEVICADVTRTRADVLAAGAYRGVLPQNALLALDRLVSGREDPPLVLTEHVRRGLLRADLGDVELFPVPGDRLVAVGGMGHSGTFGEPQLRLLARNLTWAIANLPRPRTIGTVLIGAGEGNLSVAAAVRALFLGIGDALADARVRTGIERLLIVERDPARATEIHAAVARAAGDAKAVALELKRTVTRGAGAARPARAGSRRPAPSAAQAARPIPTRLAFVKTADAVRASVITRTATIPERSLRLDPTLIDELVARMTDPDHADVARLSLLLRRMLLPRDFEGKLLFEETAGEDGADRSPVVFEVDRRLARVHWEMLAAGVDGRDGVPVALQKQVARQLRTEYSPPPAPETNPGRARRALVIGDPGDPAKGDDLPGARKEALRVAEILAARGLEVACYVGARSDPAQPALGVPPATRIDVLDRLLEGGWDVLHYAGHGDFLPDEPDRAGWVFQDGLLTSRELESMDLAPRLVVSNACLSARTSERVVTGALAEGRDAHLVATLADEFFRRGVRDYVGTAWEVNDEGAILFAEALYGALLDGRSSLGAALLRARRALAARQNVFGALWAAYQHYGDPTAALVEVSEPAARGAARRAARRSGPPRTPRTSRPRAPSGRRSAP